MATNTLTGLAPKQKRISPLNGRVDTGMGVDPIGAPRVPDPTLFPGVAPGWTAEEVEKYKGGLGAAVSAKPPTDNSGFLGMSARRISPSEEWRKIGGLRGIIPGLVKGVREAKVSTTPFGRAAWTGSSEVPPPAPVTQPTVKPAAPVSAPSSIAPPAVTPVPSGPIAPQPSKGIFVGGRAWAPGMDTQPDPALIRGSDSERWMGMTDDQQAANPDVLEGLRRETGGRGRQFIGSASATVNGRPTGLGMGQINAPAEVSPGGGRLLATYAAGQSPAAQPGYRGQTMNEAIGGRAAREHVAALASRASSALGAPSEMELSREAITNALNIESQRNAREDRNARDVLAGQERMLGAKTASEERIAGLQSKNVADELAMQERIAKIKDGMTPSEADVFTSRLASFDTEIADLQAALPKAQGEGVLNLRDADEEKRITDRLATIQTERDRLLGIGSQPQAEQAAGQPADRKKLSAEQAKAILKEAGGDPRKATAIAKQRGFDTRS